MKKRNEISLSTKDLDYDCIAISETWLKPEHKDSEYIHEKYNVFRKDRKFSDIEANKGGGVLLAINKKYDCECVRYPEMDPIEAVCVRISTNSSFIYIYNVYIRNRLNNERETTKSRYENHIAAIEKLTSMCSPQDIVVILGDFNLPSIDWMNDSDESDTFGLVPVIGDSESIEAKLTRETTSSLLDAGLHQLCGFKNHAGNVLDLAYTNTPELLSIERADLTLFPDTLRDPAHVAFTCTIECNPLQFKSGSSSPRYCFGKANYESINAELSELDFESLFAGTDIDQMVDCFYDKLNDIFDRHVPQATPRNNNLPIWYNKKMLNLRNIRAREYRKLQARRAADVNADDSKFRQSKIEFDSYEQQLYTDYIRKLAEDRKNDPKSFWRFINGKRTSNSLPSKLNFNGNTATNDMDKANLFAGFFSSVYIDHNDQFNMDAFINNRDNNGFNFEITAEAVFNVTNSIDLSKGAGPDGISPIFIRNCAETLVQPLLLIYSRSIRECKYPSRWKLGQITPIHKNGSKCDVNNYRGVTVLPNFAKLFEKLIYNQMKLIVFPRLSKSQHGFRPNKNISTNLLELSSIVHDAFERKEQVDVFYADIAKAFDSVNPSLLIRKIAKYPFGNAILRWLMSYFEDCRQAVKVGSAISNQFPVPSSVGQGSVLGPLFFLIFFDDSDDELSDSFVLNFADDKKIAQAVRHPRDAQSLQNSINKFIDWCDRNGLSVNAMKCKIMTFSLKRVTIHTDYHIRNELIDRTDTIRDLGVMLDPKLSFSSHIEFITKKAHSILAFVKRQCYKTLNIDVAKMLFFSLVRSNLEFACPVWSPHYSKYREAIESVQKQFVKFIHPNNSAGNPNNEYALRPYSIRCDELSMQTVTRRRINMCIFFIHDIISGRIKSSVLRDQLSFVKINYFTRSPEFIKLPFCRLDCTNNSPFRLACKLYNLAALFVDVTLNRYSFRRGVLEIPDSTFDMFYSN